MGASKLKHFVQQILYYVQGKLFITMISFGRLIELSQYYSQPAQPDRRALHMQRELLSLLFYLIGYDFYF